jgi:hypothetical protein
VSILLVLVVDPDGIPGTGPKLSSNLKQNYASMITADRAQIFKSLTSFEVGGSSRQRGATSNCTNWQLAYVRGGVLLFAYPPLVLKQKSDSMPLSLIRGLDALLHSVCCT